MYSRNDATNIRIIDRWDDGVGWIAHPDEDGQRTSHAVRGKDGVWVIDPIDAPGVDDLCSDLGEVVGVAVLSNWHARDAGVLANRHGVAVSLPRWMTRVEKLVEAPIRRFDTELGSSGFRIERVEPLPGWHEAVAYRESDGTIYVPDVLTTLPGSTVGSERIALSIIHRFRPPQSAFAGYEPERILVGHGSGIFEDATGALKGAFSGAQRRLPQALLSHGPTQIRMLFGAVWD